MKLSHITLLSLAMLSIAGAAEAQQPMGRIEVPELTPEQRWERAAGHVDAFLVGAIAYAKSRGDDVEALGRSIGRTFARGWGPPGSGTLERTVGSLGRNMQLWPAGQVTVVEQTPRSATLRVRRAWTTYFAPGAPNYGVTIDEYERTLAAVNEEIGNHIGLEYEQRREGDYLLITLTDPRERVTKR